MSASVPPTALRVTISATCNVWWAGTTEIMSLTSLIAYISRDTRPRKFEQPEQAVASLGEFFRAAVVGEGIDSGSVTPADVRLLFSRGQDGQLAPGRRGKAPGYLITAGDAQAGS